MFYTVYDNFKKISLHTLPFKSFFYTFKTLIIVFNKNALNWSKVTVKTFIKLQNINILNQFFLN